MEPSMLLKEQESKMDQLTEKWSKVTNRIVRHIPENKKVDYLKGITDTQKRRLLATLYENAYQWVHGMAEDTRMVQVGSFEKYVFPVIRATYANLVAEELVSVQPMPAPTGLVFYFDVLFGSNKGNVKKGTRMFDAIAGPSDARHYADEVVDEERRGTGTGAQPHFSGSLDNTPIRPGTVVLTDGTQVVQDDGNGKLAGACYAGGTIDYNTGAYDVTFLDSPDVDVAVSASYEFDMEGIAPPELELQLVSSPVVARKHALSFKWSIEAQQDLMAYHGMDAEAELVGFAANNIQKEINYKIISELNTKASAGHVVFDITPPQGVQWYFHKKALVDSLVKGSGKIFQATQRDNANWLVAGIEVCNILKTIEQFVPATVPAGTVGIRYVGDIIGLKVYEAPFFQTKKFLMGRKASGLLDAGFIYAPYLGAYTTNTIVLEDMIARKGMAVRAAQKTVNAGQYCTGEIIQSGAQPVI